MAQADDSFERRDFGWLVVMSVVFFALVAVGVWQEYSTQWKPWQRRFRTVLVQSGQLAAARKFNVGIKQIWVPDIGVVDRCVSCHLGYDYGRVLPANLPEPLTPHPDLPFMSAHPFEKFGCTTCHGGQGWATSAAAAHQAGPGWDEPMLSRSLAASCGVTEGELMQIRCNYCHRLDPSTRGMDQINLAKQLIKKYKCLICHTVAGQGGHSAPELTYEGDKDPDLFDFTHVTGPRTVFNWQVQHLIAAGTVWPGTAMPDFHMPIAQARAIALMLLSWKKLNYPPQYIPPSPAAGN
jgi:hypothetical protein